MTASQSTPTPEIEQEEWRPVVGWEDLYSVSNLGRVRRVAVRGRAHVPFLKTWPDDHGYPRVGLWRNGKGKFIQVHRLIAMAFLGPIPEGHEVHHKDNDKTNCHPSNLEYVTSSENKIHAIRGGHWSRCRLNPQMAREIRASTDTYRVLAARYNVSMSAIWSVRRGRTWNHADDERWERGE
jgi:hypothetical protein